MVRALGEKKDDKSNLSTFQTLIVSTATRVGMGNLVGVVAAVSVGGAGSVKIEAGAAGKVFKIEASVGQAVKKGDAVLVLEIMKMETPVVAPQDGTVASINVNVGDMVEAGALLATLN